MLRAWAAAERAAGRKADTLPHRITREMSEPVSQRILQPYEGSRHLPCTSAYPGAWPKEAHTTTNVLCAIMQACLIGHTLRS